VFSVVGSSPTAASGSSVHRVVLGRSVKGRTITAVRQGRPRAGFKILVVGCIHGNEAAGIPIVRRLRHMAVPRSLDLWTIKDVNPDGHARGTRQNARGVDLNRNFPYRWQASGRPGDTFYSGPRPLSEPESRIAHRFILHRKPDLTIWFHQHMDIVERIGHNVTAERRYARLVGLPLKRLPHYPGTATRWQNHRIAGTTGFVVELPAGELSQRAVKRYASAVLKLLP
jgi:protein MpaA